MKKIVITGFAVLLIQLAGAQQKEGRVVYELTIRGGKSTFSINGETQTINRPDRINKMELLFGNNQSVRNPLEEETPEVEMAGNGPGVHFSMNGNAADAIVYHNFTEERRVEQRESLGKKFLINDSIRKQNWKFTGDTKTLLGYPCQKAISQTTAKTMRMTMADGEMKRTEVTDTMNIVVWFTPAIPVPAGPDYQGQLPGLILEINIKDGSTVTKAVEISPTVTMAAIKEPKGGKKVTAAKYREEVDEAMKEMMDRGPVRMSARPAN